MTVNAPGMRTETGTPTWRSLYFVAGIGSIVFVLLLISALVIDFIAPPPVDGGAETLEFIAANKVPYVLEQVLWILPNVLAVLVFVALFIALFPVNKSLALIGAILGGLSWAMFLAIPVTSRGSLTLVYLSDQYMAATAAERERFAIAAEAIVAENNTPAIVAVLSAAGILLISIVMTRGVMPRAIGWLGVATGALGMLSEALRYAAPFFYWGYGILLWVWFIAVGVALIMLGRRTPRVSGPGALPLHPTTG
ncbi:MAG: DUF4386 domain-containing protein [Microbacterium hominis]|jgi:hypothetical protein|uniref:DUF4386 family protein n=1 Tax=Microbacterium aurum TaxID=36805 RepID=UPI00248DE536|nr:DUF4386 family protein [Microbacterium aurum]MBZ6371553.1 DUF4386 domain-containing protein [Microbacterium hominis]